ncbi:MAG: helix-turn-helix transcriptional regulator [Phycisphaeraceae bacterium]|nr:helix-turn-helix transcriptional regulator [Phycisphaeraceae bacterium]
MATTFPRFEIGGKRYVIVPEKVYDSYASTEEHGKSKDIARRVAEVRAGTAQTRSAKEFSRELIAEDLRKDRASACITQAQLSEQSGIRIETISRIEQKKTTARPETLDKLYRVIDQHTK